MTRFDPHTLPGQIKTQTQPGAWVKTHLESANTYSLKIVEKTKQRQQVNPNPSLGCAYGKLSLLESGAIMASFPVMGMASCTIRNMLGATWFELATPLILPAFVFGHDMEIPAGRHPIVFVLENWMVLFAPPHTLRL